MKTKLTLTTNDACSPYGILVLVDDAGNAYGPSDDIQHTGQAEGGGAAGTAGYLVAARANRGEEDVDEALAYCAQWPEGPQPENA